MKHFLYISAFILFYLLTCSKSCDSGEQRVAERQQVRIKNEIDSVTTFFSSETLSSETLRAFGETAKINFTDFLDYIKIFSDTNTAPAFKDHARKMILHQFVTKNNVFIFSLRTEPCSTIVTINDLLDPESLYLEYLSLIQTDSLWYKTDLQPVNDSVFLGQIGFSFIPLVAQTNQRNHFSGSGFIEVGIEKRRREFGNDTLNLWTTFLGNAAILASKEVIP